MDRIEGQVADSRKLAKQILSWITCATRHLTTAELQHALAVEIGESELDGENLPEIEDMISTCAGLVTVEQETRIIRLVHYTTEEYFKRTRNHWFPDVEVDIARTCVSYLSFDTFKSGSCQTDDEFERRLRLNPLYCYAVGSWSYHVHVASLERDRLILTFLKSEAKVSASTQAMMILHLYHNSRSVAKQITGGHLAAYLGLKEAMAALLEDGHCPDTKDTHL